MQLQVKSNQLPALIAAMDGIQDGLVDGVADKAVSNIAERAPKRTGRGAASYHKEYVGVGHRIVTNTADAYYMLFQELGTRHMAAQPHFVAGGLAAADEADRLFTALVAAAIGG